MAGAATARSRPADVPAAGRLAERVHQARARRRGRAASRSASRSSAAAPPAWPAPTACCSCSADDPETMERSARSRSRSSRRPRPAAGTTSPARSCARGRCRSCSPSMTREDWRKEGFAFGEVDQGGRLPDADRQAHASASRRRRRSRTTATRSSRSPRWRATSSAQAEEGGAYILTETAATQLLVEDGARRRRALGRQGPRQGRRAAGQLRARHRHHGQGDGARRGLLGPPHRRRDPRVRPRRGPRAAGLGARRQGGLEGPQAAGPPDPHDRARGR